MLSVFRGDSFFGLKMFYFTISVQECGCREPPSAMRAPCEVEVLSQMTKRLRVHHPGDFTVHLFGGMDSVKLLGLELGQYVISI